MSAPSESVYWSLWSAINAYVEACGGDNSRSTGVVVAAMAEVYEAVDDFAASRVTRSGRIDDQRQVWHHAFVAWYAMRYDGRNERTHPDSGEAGAAARYADRMVECYQMAMELRAPVDTCADCGRSKVQHRRNGACRDFEEPARFDDVGSTEKSTGRGGGAGTPDTGGAIGRGGGNR